MLSTHRVLPNPAKRIDLQVLFDPAKEQLDPPAKLVELDKRKSQLKKDVRQEGQPVVVLPVVEPNSTRISR